MIFDPAEIKLFSLLTQEIKEEYEDKAKPFRVGTSKEFPKVYKKLIDHFKELKAIPKTLKGPIFTGIDPTYRCNLSCPYCYLKAPLNTSELSTDEWIYVFDELASLNVLTVCFSGGEPTLRDDLLELIEQASEGFRAVNMATNGLLINEEFSKRLKESGISAVQVSLDGSSSSVMDKLRGRGTYKRVIKAIETLIANNIPTIVSFACTKFNISDFPNVVKLASELGALSVRVMYLIPEAPHLAPSDEEYFELTQWVTKNRQNYPINIELGDPLEHIKVGPFLPLLSIAITPDGFILPTPYVPLAYGHVKHGLRELYNEGLSNVWQHPVFKALSNKLKSEFDVVHLNNFLKLSHENVVDVKGLNNAGIRDLVGQIQKVLNPPERGA
jgi:MoaA/NifB/PqqE/SkfB family radical SAM enzyme